MYSRVRMITLSINVNKIDKSRLKEGKNGAKYLDLTLNPNRDGVDQYGNTGIVSQSTTKEERANKVRLPIIGNYKEWNFDDKPKRESKPAPKPYQSRQTDDEGDDIPFN